MICQTDLDSQQSSPLLSRIDLTSHTCRTSQVVAHAHVTGCGSEGRVAKRYLMFVYNRSNWTLSCEFQRHQHKMHPLQAKEDPSLGAGQYDRIR